MATVNPVQTTTYALSVWNSTVSFGDGTDINVANGFGIYGANQWASWLVNNRGDVAGTSGVVLNFISALTNQGNITGTAGPGVSMTGGGLFTNYAGAVVSGSGAQGWGVSMSTTGGGYGAVDNAFTNHGLIQGTAGGVSLSGWTRAMNDGTIQGGAVGIAMNGGGVLNDAGTITGSTTAVQFGGHGPNALILQDGATLNGAIVGSPLSGAYDSITLYGSGVLNGAIQNFDNLVNNGSGTWTLNNTSSITNVQVRSSGGLQVGDASHPNATLTVGSLQNGGSISVDGVMHVTGAVTGPGSLFILDGGMLDLGSTVRENIQFSGDTGVLELQNSQSFGGSVSGFDPSGAAIDLRDIAFVGPGEISTKTTGWGVSLTVHDLTHSAKISLIGDFSGSTFVAQSDGHGGTLVFDPAAASNAQLASLLHQTLGATIV
jgi:hypothetical protein